MSAPLIEVRNLSTRFVIRRSWNGRPLTTVQAVEDVSFSIRQGETLGLVGETGCGKSTVGRTLIGLYDPSAGSAMLDGIDIHAALRSAERKSFRRRLQMIFQDPYASLDPRMTVGDIVGEALDIHTLTVANDRRDRINELLAQVGLNPEHAGRFPHEFSGGQRQRVGIARALAAQPDFIVCDEPISALVWCFDSGANRQPAAGPAGKNRPDLPVHRPRSFHGPPHQSPHRRHVSRFACGGRNRRRAFQLPLPPLYAGAAFRHTHTRSGLGSRP